MVRSKKQIEVKNGGVTRDEMTIRHTTKMKRVALHVVVINH
jgi:hypothetical protein